jgi:hypothetical protein
LSTQPTEVHADAADLRAEVLDLHNELTALKSWLGNPLFVAKLLERLLAHDPNLRATAGFIIQALRSDFRAGRFEQ